MQQQHPGTSVASGHTPEVSLLRLHSLTNIMALPGMHESPYSNVLSFLQALHLSIAPTFHDSLLKPVFPSAHDYVTGAEPRSPLQGGPVHTLGALHDSRQLGNRMCYLAKWEDYGPEGPSSQ